MAKSTACSDGSDHSAARVPVALWRAAFQVSRSPICLLDNEGKALSCNRAMADLLGRPSAEICGLPCGEFLPQVPDRLALVAGTLRRQMSELSLRGRWFHVIVDPIPDENGRLAGMMLILAAVPVRGETREALLEANARLHTLQQATAAVHGSIDLDEVFRRITEGVVHSLGYNTAFVLMLDRESERLETKAVSTRTQLLSRIGEVLGVSLDRFSFSANPGWNAVPGALMQGTSVVAGTLSEIAYPIVGRQTCMVIQKLTGTKRYVVVPLQVEDDLMGGMVVASTQDQVSEEELSVLEALAHSASNAIANASLYAQARQAEADIARAAEALRERERLFRQTFDAIPDPAILWKCEPDGRIVMSLVNPAADVMSEGKIADFMGATVDEFFAGAPNVVANIRRALATGEPIRVELPYRLRTTGEDKWVTADYAKVSDDYLLNTIRDVTERVEAEQALRTSEGLLSRAEEMAHLGSWEWDVKENRVTFSDEWQRIHGCRVSQLLMEDVLSIVHADDRPAVKWALDRSLEAGEPYDIEYRVVSQDSGEVRVVKARGEVLYDGDEPIRLRGACQDVTERVQAQQALRASEEFLHRTGEMARVGGWEIDLDTNMVMWTRTTKTIHEVPDDYEPTVEQASEFFPGESREAITQALQNAIDHGEAYDLELEFVSANGRHLWVHTIGRPEMENGQCVRLSGTFQDVTERKGMEHALRESNRQLQKALEDLRETQEQMVRRERLAAVGQLAAGIAHDFRNLMTAIILYAELSLRSEGLSLDLVQNLEAILGESRRAADLVQQILDFSSHSIIEVRPVDLEALTEGVLGVLQRTIPENIRLVLDVSPKGAPFVVKADPGRIEQALMNLSLNARDAMPHGGELRFGLSKIRLGPGDEPPVADMPAGEWVCLAVADTGTGMVEEVRAHLFEPFFTTKEVGEGTGLGLAQVYGIVRQHEGYIGVDTERGQGTTFCIYLLACEVAETSVEDDCATTPRGQGETLLLVEDSDKLRDAGRGMLESLGYRVLSAANGRDALALYEARGGVALVITDLVMPEMGGKELVQELRRLDPNVKALGLTGYATEDMTSELSEAGFLEVIHKPFQVGALARAIRRALDAH